MSLEEKIESFREELHRTIRFHNNILENEKLPEYHHDSKVCLEILNPIYHTLDEILKTSTPTVKKDG